MNYSPAYILAQLLINEGYAVAPSDSGDWPLYIANLPDGSKIEHNVLAIYDTAGMKDGRVMNGSPLFHRGIQIRIRAREYNTAYQKISEIALYLATVINELIAIGSDDYKIVNITQTSDVIRLGQEESKRREEFTVNFLMTIEEE